MVSSRTASPRIGKYRFLIILITALLSVSALSAQERGKASYYANNMTGRKMSSGIRYHKDSLFCAHKTYPFGTLLKVVNPSNGKSVVVKVVDRGPHTRGRIIDLSYRAAKELGMIAAGVAAVEVSVYHPEKAIPFKPDEVDDWPEFEFEVSDDEGYEPAWKPSKSQKEEDTKQKK